MVHSLALLLRSMSNSYHSSFTQKLSCARNQHFAALASQNVSNMAQQSWQLLQQHSLVCQGALSLRTVQVNLHFLPSALGIYHPIFSQASGRPAHTCKSLV